jgi:hypothetical protein
MAFSAPWLIVSKAMTYNPELLDKAKRHPEKTEEPGQACGQEAAVDPRQGTAGEGLPGNERDCPPS